MLQHLTNPHDDIVGGWNYSSIGWYKWNFGKQILKTTGILEGIKRILGNMICQLSGTTSITSDMYLNIVWDIITQWCIEIIHQHQKLRIDHYEPKVKKEPEETEAQKATKVPDTAASKAQIGFI